jgi:hypothetical protein
MNEIMAVATVALAILTAAYVVLTGRILRSQTDPEVIIYVENSENNPACVDLVIENVGSGMATDVRLRLSRPMRKWALPVAAPCASLFDEGIAVLPPRAKRRLFLGLYTEAVELIGPTELRAWCTYRRHRDGIWGRETDPAEFLLDFKSLAEIQNTRNVADELARVAQALETISRSGIIRG